ncbi:LacI family DNA-binding transcriptional regulator [Amaricoccus tamworthensis]|uniref:LacI family DNA-binding transcriptional regulator n=1 Tax=Amaricoccus tamworthensis TaxID=57002 RepID=UPI003C7AC967
MKVTLKEIATRVGVAESTVSRVLSKEPTLSISDERRRAILETAEELNYVRPKRAPPARTKRKTETEVVVLCHALTADEELSRPFYVGVRKGIEAAALERDVRILRADPSVPLAFRSGERALGVIVIGVVPDDVLSTARALDLPVVFADQPARDPEAGDDSVVTDVDLAVGRALDLLKSQGCSRLACVDLVDVQTSASTVGRGRFFKPWSMDNGGFDADYLIIQSRDQINGRQAISRMFEKLREQGKPLPDGLLATTDLVAAEAYQGIAAEGLSIPDDIRVVGMGDNSIAQLLTPPLASVEIPAGDIGRTAFDLVIERSSGRRVAKTVTLHTTFVARESLGIGGTG